MSTTLNPTIPTPDEILALCNRAARWISLRFFAFNQVSWFLDPKCSDCSKFGK